MARGHGNHQALALSSNHPIKRFSNLLVVLTDQHLRPHVLTEVQEVLLRFFLSFNGLEPQFKAQEFRFMVRGGWMHSMERGPRTTILKKFSIPPGMPFIFIGGWVRVYPLIGSMFCGAGGRAKTGRRPRLKDVGVKMALPAYREGLGPIGHGYRKQGQG